MFWFLNKNSILDHGEFIRGKRSNCLQRNIGPAIYDRYGEDMMMVEPIDFVFSKEAFKTTKAYVSDFMSAIKTEKSKFTTRALEDWESFGYSLINALKIKELCDYTVDLEKYIEDIFIQMNNSKMYQGWNQRAKKIKEKEYLQKNKIRRRIFSNPKRMMQINIWNISKYLIVYFINYINLDSYFYCFRVLWFYYI